MDTTNILKEQIKDRLKDLDDQIHILIAEKEDFNEKMKECDRLIYNLLEKTGFIINSVATEISRLI